MISKDKATRPLKLTFTPVTVCGRDVFKYKSDRSYAKLQIE